MIVNKNYFFLFVCLWLVAIACSPKDSLQKKDQAFNKINSLKEKYKPLPIDEVRPWGWLIMALDDNLSGFAGHLDSLAPDLVVKDDIYGKDRLSKKVSSKNVGALGAAGDWQVQFLWWNSETQSNWRDGYIRSAIMLDNEDLLDGAESYVARILASQDTDGYLGIYDKELRYKFDNENGELWSKATLLRGLLAWYEYKKDSVVLNAIVRASDNVMKNYPVDDSRPFYSKTPNVGGTSHGLMITDVFESLYRITGKETYRDYCLFLYKDFSNQVLNEDAQFEKLMNDTLMLKGHGVHTYEHLRSLSAAYYASGNPELKTALDKFLVKIGMETTASGAGVGDEWIGGRKADATSRGYEYCSLQELMHSYTDLLLKSGDPSYADKAENIFFNAALGARLPDGSAIAYLKSDNSFYMTGGLNGETKDKNQTRYTYSPVHKEAAVCCVPNAGRIFPYYINNMWLKDDESLVASLLGPSTVKTRVAGLNVLILEETQYPFSNKFRFDVTAAGAFKLKIRKPEWVGKFAVSEKYTEEEGFIVIDKKWNGKETVSLEFFPEIMVRKDINNETFFTYGSLVLARPIGANETITKTFSLTGFYNKTYVPKDLVVYEYVNEPVTGDARKLTFTTTMYNPVAKQKEQVELVPMFGTILRQVTFKNSQ